MSVNYKMIAIVSLTVSCFLSYAFVAWAATRDDTGRSMFEALDKTWELKFSSRVSSMDLASVGDVELKTEGKSFALKYALLPVGEEGGTILIVTDDTMPYEMFGPNFQATAVYKKLLDVWKQKDALDSMIEPIIE